MTIEISVGTQDNREIMKTLDDEVLAIAYVFHLLTEKGIPSKDIFIYNSETGKLQDLNEWTGTPEGEEVI